MFELRDRAVQNNINKQVFIYQISAGQGSHVNCFVFQLSGAKLSPFLVLFISLATDPIVSYIFEVTFISFGYV